MSRQLTTLRERTGHAHYSRLGDEYVFVYWEETATGNRTTFYRAEGGREPSRLFSYDASFYSYVKLRGASGGDPGWQLGCISTGCEPELYRRQTPNGEGARGSAMCSSAGHSRDTLGQQPESGAMADPRLALEDETRKSAREMPGQARLLRDDDLRELLVSRGFRVTEQRLVILRELAKLRIPTSHPELTERLAGSDLDRATIYRNLLSLTEAGVLIKTQLGDNVWRFELPRSTSTEHGTHPHFICSDCGSISCLPTTSVALRGEAARNEVAEVQLRGRCTDCVRA